MLRSTHGNTSKIKKNTGRRSSRGVSKSQVKATQRGQDVQGMASGEDRGRVGREIKFRAWNKKDQNMLYQIKTMENGCNSCALQWWDDKEDIGYEINIGTAICDDQFILMQYAGLKDKNGKEIYEGDILGYWGSAVWPVRWDQSTAQYVAYHKDGNRAFKISLASTYDKKIIGNIYLNPQLLK